MLQIKNLRGGYIKDSEILQSLNLEVTKSDAVGIIGLNGSGKSTLAKAIMNTLPYRSGEIYFNGEDISKKSTQELSDLGITFFMQGGKVFDDLSVWDNLLLTCENKKNIEEIQKYFVLLQVSKKQLTKMRADRLSGGERHQLALAMCLLKVPSMLILDEPSAGLSPKAVNNLYFTLNLLREEKDLTILLIEQNVAKAIDFCTSVNLLREGKIAHQFENQDLKEIEKIMFNFN
jgi:ABC-type branched-subunit amino acid transport system ATPase component